MKFSAKFEYALLALLYLKCEPDEDPISGSRAIRKAVATIPLFRADTRRPEKGRTGSLCPGL